MRSVRFALGSRAYDAHVGEGTIEALDTLAAQAGLANAGSFALVADRATGPAVERVASALRRLGKPVHEIVLDVAESSKSMAGLDDLYGRFIDAKFDRSGVVVALGGGVVGDLAGFAAATVRRGMRFVQIPTSLLAQVDSSVGGKTGINSPHGKHLIGAFHQPILVLADTAALASLPPREFRAGYAEVVKYGLIGDAALFGWLEANWVKVFAGGAERIHAIAKSCAAKAAVVARDEREEADRALLNFGHTFGHALERLVGYDGKRLVHGEAVGIGMACAFRFSARRGLCHSKEAERVETHLMEAGLPIRIQSIAGWDADADQILDAMYQDKKVQHGALTFILARGIGRCFIAKNVEAAEVRAFLAEELDQRVEA
jgi:shikimate kinase/3-dehydroquinate synthase